MKNNKVFLITIDTEGDDQWQTNDISTKNSKFLPRFQELAEKYNFKPVWLTNYEMANDNFFVDYMKKKQDNHLCEIGMHLHAWYNPPEYKLNKINNEKDYLIEYPVEIMDLKIKKLTNLLEEKFGVRPVSHRSGRWATNEDYFKLLKKYGYLVDCSVTPHFDWTVCLGSTGLPGTNYKDFSESPYYVENTNILEVPVTIRKIHVFQSNRIKNIINFCGEVTRLVFGRYQWIRPNQYSSLNIKEMKKVIDLCNNDNHCIMFMIHSSELMPGGSPTFKSEQDIERLYSIIESIFKYVKDSGYIGMTLRDYYNYFNRK